jgi:hypothetical protein
MRRLIASVAVTAAALLGPSAALGAPVITAPAATVDTNVAPIAFTWTDATPEAAFRLLRDTSAGGACPAAPSGSAVNTTPVDLPGTATTASDTPPEGTYCYYVEATDATPTTTDSSPVLVTYDITPPVIASVTTTGGDGCSPFTVSPVVNADTSGVASYAADGVPVTLPFSPAGAIFDPPVTVQMTATDGAGNVSLPSPVTGRIFDPTRPPAPTLEVTTDSSQPRAMLSWTDPPGDGAPVIAHHLRTKGPQGTSPTNLTNGETSITVPIAQVDATYEFTLSAADACGDGPSTVRLVRLTDTTPPTMPIVAGPVLDPASHVVSLSWVAATDNIQVDHYEILRNGVPLGATDATSFTDVLPIQHALLSYVVRAVDTNGNATDSAPALITTPDWTPPTAPVLDVSMSGTVAVLRWSAATDNIGVVAYDVLRDGSQIASMTAAVRTYRDAAVTAGKHTWQVRARDDAGLSALSAAQSAKVVKSKSRASVLQTRLVGSPAGAPRYLLKARSRLLVDVRVIGTVSKGTLRLYVSSGSTRLTLWRGTPGSSSPRLRLGSALARHGYVSIRLNRTLHAGRIRLVLIASGKVVVAGTGAHEPALRSA